MCEVLVSSFRPEKRKERRRGGKKERKKEKENHISATLTSEVNARVLHFWENSKSREFL
jgi:hypothetical protein